MRSCWTSWEPTGPAGSRVLGASRQSLLHIDISRRGRVARQSRSRGQDSLEGCKVIVGQARLAEQSQDALTNLGRQHVGRLRRRLKGLLNYKFGLTEMGKAT